MLRLLIGVVGAECRGCGEVHLVEDKDDVLAGPNQLQRHVDLAALRPLGLNHQDDLPDQRGKGNGVAARQARGAVQHDDVARNLA